MYKKVFIAELDQLYDMLDFIKNFSLNRAIPSTLLDQIILASEEALVNIIHYSYSKDKKGNIEITCEDCQEEIGIKIVITDQGIPFNPVKQIPYPRPNRSNSLGGYGIYLLLELMDSVEYQRIDNENVLSLTKYLK